MKIVIDSNVLFSALIKDSSTRKLILKYGGFFLFPSYIFEEMEKHKEQAVEIVKNIDLDDAIFVACALAYPESVIWSDDKKLKNQKEVKILNTGEMIKYFKEV